MSDSVAVPREMLQALLDVAVNSMDFGSGFLDDEEVDALRAVAVLLGVDPMDVTPSGHKCKHGAPHGWYSYKHGPPRCLACGQVRP